MKKIAIVPGLLLLSFILFGCVGHEHSYLTETTVSPGCLTDGLMTYTCECGDTYTEPIHSKGKHDWNEGEVSVPMSCLSDGTIQYTCTSCGETREEPIVSPGEHSWNEGTVTSAMTCLSDGTMVYTCTSCGETREEAIPSPGSHTWSDPVTVKLPSCTEPGQTSITCTVCGETEYTTLDASGHSWDDGVVTLEPACLEAGILTFTCTVCGETRTESLPKIGEHDWNSGKVTAESACGEPGVKTYVCRKCGEEKTEPLPLLEEHTWDSGIVLKDSNCAELGDMEYTCKICGRIRAVKIAMTKTHTWNTGTVKTAASCSLAGEMQYTCVYCDAEKTEPIPATGKHIWDAGTVTHPASCGTTGARLLTCTVCQSTASEAIPATGNHLWDEGRVTKAATMLAEGTRTFTCTVCGGTSQSSIPKVVDEKTAVYTTDSTLYINEIPVHGILKMDGKYYIPLEILDDENIIPEGIVNTGFYQDYYYVNFEYNRYDKKISFTDRENLIDPDRLLGTGAPSDIPLKYNKTMLNHALWILNGEYPMTRLDLIGAKQKGNDFYISLTLNATLSKEDDLIGEVLPSLRRTTDRETVCAIHDWIVNKITYNPLISRPWWATQQIYEQANNAIIKAESEYYLPNNITISSGYGVCQNYAEIFREMCSRLGIICKYVSGMGNSSSHGWNKVCLDGEWLYVDCTFDDPVSQTPICSRDYCLVGPEVMVSNHEWNGDDYPMPAEYDPAWEQLDCNNITSADMFRKCLVAQLMQKKTSFLLRTTAAGAYGGFSCLFHYNVGFSMFRSSYDYEAGGYRVNVEYWD